MPRDFEQGIAADNGTGTVSFAEAAERSLKAGVLNLIYASPSHTRDIRRWRILCPLSEEMPPERRHHYMGRLNGLFRGIFSNESWTLSESYCFGSVNRNPFHQVEIIDGRPIDDHDDLDTAWIGKPGSINSMDDAAELGAVTLAKMPSLFVASARESTSISSCVHSPHGTLVGTFLPTPLRKCFVV